MSLTKACTRHQRMLAKFALHVFGDGWWRDTNCVFVLSTGRSGTETLTRLLDLSPAISAFHEPRPQLLPERQAAFGQVWDNPKKFRDIFCNARAVPITASKLRKKTYAETSARLTFLAPAIAEVAPNSRFIHLVRHPGAVIRSGMRRGWYERHAADAYRITPQTGSDAFAKWNDWSRFEKICWYWDAYNRFACKFAEVIEPQRIIRATSEELFDPDSREWERLFDFVGVPRPKTNAVQHVLGVRHNSQQLGDFPPFTEWDESQKTILASIAGDTMVRLGFDAPNLETSVVYE